MANASFATLNDGTTVVKWEAAVHDSAPGDATALVAMVAANIRRLRERGRLSLSELAVRAGLAKSTLSQLEAGHANPSVETLWAVAAALGVPFGQLISLEPADVRVVRAGDGTRVGAEGSPFEARLLAASTRRGAHELYVLEAEPGPPREAASHLPGLVEHLYVVRGAMETGPVEAPVELTAGDLASFAGDVPHLYRALVPGTVAVLVMDYP